MRLLAIAVVLIGPAALVQSALQLNLPAALLGATLLILCGHAGDISRATEKAE